MEKGAVHTECFCAEECETEGTGMKKMQGLEMHFL